MNKPTKPASKASTPGQSKPTSKAKTAPSSQTQPSTTKNLRVRVIVGATMFIVALISLYTFDSIPFKVIYALFSVMAAVELMSFLERRFSIGRALMALAELGLLIGGAVFVARVSLGDFWYIILGVCGYDIFAYFIGLLIGGKLFKHSRPFPYISKNKTWEGTLGGLLMSLLLTSIYMATHGGHFEADWPWLLTGVLALTGDLYESLLKRQFGIKDSNEIVIKNPIFAKIEYLVGGSKGHGGFLDRVDSVAFTTTVLLLTGII